MWGVSTRTRITPLFGALCLRVLAGGVLGCESVDIDAITAFDGGDRRSVSERARDGATRSGDGGVASVINCQSDARCKLQRATSACQGGQCVITRCQAGYGDCNGDVTDGCEATLNSPEHCGACERACSFANAKSACDDGACRLVACAKSFGDCDLKLANGCERSLRTVRDCGACGATCSLPNAAATCDSGRCALLSCNAGFGDCNGIASDGCETPLDGAEHCGKCDVRCDPPKPNCGGGRCSAISCDATHADCDGDDSSCETDLHTLEDCGACGVACGPFPNASATCAEGRCAASCKSGFRDCDNQLANGCEADLRTAAHCGDCGKSCAYPHALTSCAAGSCTSSGCEAGFGDCNGDLAGDGCEEALDSAEHCGACGRACNFAHAAASCTNASCQLGACQQNYGDCDGLADNGCEVDLATTSRHCGACGAACPNNRACIGGHCVCTSNANCGSNQKCCNGACVDTRGDELNCGGCGTVCAASQTCCNGSCKNLASDFNNCGSCAARCNANTADRCESGRCSCANDTSCPAFSRCCRGSCQLALFCR